MKRLLILLLIVLGIAVAASAQKVKLDSNGNYVSVSSSAKRDTVFTGKYYTDSKGISYEVYKSATGKLYCPRISKTGHYYRYYLKVN